jgi:ankyrin repeat protein
MKSIKIITVVLASTCSYCHFCDAADLSVSVQAPSFKDIKTITQINKLITNKKSGEAKELLAKTRDGKKLDVNVWGSDGFCPLHCAVQVGDFAMVKYLVEQQGAGVNVLTKADRFNVSQFSPMDIADFEQNDAIVSFLKAHGAQQTNAFKFYVLKNFRNDFSNTIKHDAMLSMLKRRFEKYSQYYDDFQELDFTDRPGNNLLHKIVLLKDDAYLKVVKYLVRTMKFNVNQRNSLRQTPLDLHPSPEIKKYLLKKGAQRSRTF